METLAMQYALIGKPDETFEEFRARRNQEIMGAFASCPSIKPISLEKLGALQARQRAARSKALDLIQQHGIILRLFLVPDRHPKWVVRFVDGGGDVQGTGQIEQIAIDDLIRNYVEKTISAD